jgi:hypothetical protein
VRYSSRPLPARRYLPGRGARPKGKPAAVSRLDPDRWPECEPYLHAIDLFNHRYWWECHEALEALWIAEGRRGEVARFLQGLIQVAAHNLRRELERRSDPGKALANLKGFGEFLGVDVSALRSAVERGETPRITLRIGGRRS